MKKGYAKMAAVLSVSTITILGSTAVSPALSGIKSAFPQMSDSWIQMILTLPTLLIIPSCLLCRYAISKMGQKNVLLMGIIIYLIGGLGSGLAKDFYMLLVFRGILGIGCGFITPMAQNLISSNFTGETRQKLTSYSASASYLMGIIASFLVGRLVGINWRMAFLIYLVALVVLLLNIVYLPDDRKNVQSLDDSDITEGIAVNVSNTVKNVKTADSRKDKKLANMGINVKAILVMIAMFGINGAFYTFSASISLFMRTEGIGNETSSGIVVSAFMICGFIVGLIVHPVRKILKEYTIVLGCFMMGAGYILLSQSSNIPILMIASAMVGGSYSILYSEVFTKIRQAARSEEETTTLVTYTTACMFLGQALSQYILRGVECVAGISGYRFRFVIVGALLLLSMAGCIIKNIVPTGKKLNK